MRRPVVFGWMIAEHVYAALLLPTLHQSSALRFASGLVRGITAAGAVDWTSTTGDRAVTIAFSCSFVAVMMTIHEHARHYLVEVL
jgi:hypothetical protein